MIACHFLNNGLLFLVQSDAELRIAAVTGTNRNTWAQIRIDHFSSGINRDSMHAIEESLFLVREQLD